MRDKKPMQRQREAVREHSGVVQQQHEFQVLLLTVQVREIASFRRDLVHTGTLP